MFIQKPRVSRDSWHYHFWSWTFQNWFWNKEIPSQRSICAYCQRMFWIGALILIPLHILWFVPRVVIYKFLYDKMLRHITKYDSIAAFLIWGMILAAVYFTRIEYLMPSTIIAAVVFAAILLSGVALVVLTVIIIFRGIKWLWENVAVPILKFDWQIYRRYYVPKYRLPDDEYRYDHGQNQLMLHILLWLQLVLLFVLPYGGGRFITGGPIHSALFVWMLFGLVMFYAVVTRILVLYVRDQQKEDFYRLHPEQRPQPKPKKEKQSKKAKKHTGESSWKLFKIWLKAKKQKVCPLVEFVD